MEDNVSSSSVSVVVKKKQTYVCLLIKFQKQIVWAILTFLTI